MNKIYDILDNNNINSNESKMLQYLTVNNITITAPTGHVTIEYNNELCYVSITTMTAKAITSLASELASGSTINQIMAYLSQDCTNRKKLRLITTPTTNKNKPKLMPCDVDSDTYKAQEKHSILECMAKIEAIIKQYGYYIDYQEDIELVFNSSDCGKTYREMIKNETVSDYVLQLLSSITYISIKKVSDVAYKITLSDELSLRDINSVELQLNMIDNITVAGRSDNIINILIEDK